MSTSAEIGRSPIASSRSLQPARARPVAARRGCGGRGTAGRPCRGPRDAIAIGERKRPGDRRRVERLQRPSPAAARSRAMPRTPRQSARFGVTLMSITGIVETERARRRARRPARRRGSSMMPVVIVAERQLVGRAQHAARGDAADRAFLQHRAGARDGRRRPARRRRFMPARALGAPHTTCTSPVAGIDDADAQPVGIGMRLGRDDARDDEAARAPAARFSMPSTSRPSMTSARDDLVERGASVSRCVLSQASVVFIAPGPRTSEGMSSGRKP